MEKVTTCFTLSYTNEQYSEAQEYVKDMKTKGLPGEEALKFCLERIYQLQK